MAGSKFMTRNQRAALDQRAIARAATSILAIYLDAPTLTREAGARWYSEEADRCAFFGRVHSIPAHCVAGAAAAISPGMRWDAVFAHLSYLVKNPNARVPTYSKEFVRRAVRCLKGEDPAAVLSGPKVTAFYALLARLDLTAVVIDGHAWNICIGKPLVFRQRPGFTPPKTSRVTARRYRLAAAAYRQVAADLGIPAHAVQATVWLHWRTVISGKVG